MVTAYEAVNERPRVFCAYGKTPAKALKNMAKLLKENKIDDWSSINVVADYEAPELNERFHLVLYV